MRLTAARRNERGDTIVEVLFAVAVFAMVAVGSLSIMNQGTATAQRALEITLVRQQIDAQAEAIRYIHQSYVAGFQKGGTPTGTAAEWIKMTQDRAEDSASDFGQIDTNGRCPAQVPGQNPFIINARQAKVSTTKPTMSPPANGSLPPFSQVAYNDDGVSIKAAYGMWVEAVPSKDTSIPGFVDFHIRACWDSPGSSAPVTLGTIVRLYEPR